MPHTHHDQETPGGLLTRSQRNLLHSVLLIGGMAALLAACAWIVAGPSAVLWTLVFAALGLMMTPTISSELVLHLFGAKPLPAGDLPEVHRLVRALVARAGLQQTPALYYIASPTMNAFTLGKRDDATIAMTSGLLRRLSLRELAGVLAHEISHIRHNDMWVMGLADMISRMTRVMSFLGVWLLILNIPLMLTGAGQISWLLLILLVFAPTIGTLLQLALSRVREYDADADAAHLTGDPAGLAAALETLEQQQGRFWEDIVLPGRRAPEPSVLRSHPHTSERIKRLMAMRPRRPLIPADALAAPWPRHSVIPDSPHRPRWRKWGMWY